MTLQERDNPFPNIDFRDFKAHQGTVRDRDGVGCPQTVETLDGAAPFLERQFGYRRLSNGSHAQSGRLLSSYLTS